MNGERGGMITVAQAVDRILLTQTQSAKPLVIMLAGHNGSGKSTMWRDKLSPKLRIPLINADRIMMSVLPRAVQFSMST
jgi:hypothetical protein